jgi:hypothetical protein
MFREKMNEKIIRAYINASNDWRYAATVFASYVVLASVLMVFTPAVMANGQDVLTIAQEMIRELAGAIRGISTAAAIVGVGTGAFFKKFSLGKPDRIETGNKLIMNSIWGWILINGLIIILNWFANRFGVTADDSGIGS